MRWIIGDIHGMLKPLDTLIDAIERHDPQRQLMFVGDYVNRGPDSKGVIDFLLSLRDSHFIRGNHDDVFDQVVNGKSLCGKPGEENRIAAFQWFLQHGLDKTLLSYGIKQADIERVLKAPSSKSLDDLVAPVPQTHRDLVRNLPVVLESDGMFVAHAKWDVYTSTDQPPISDRVKGSDIVRYTLIWGRYRADELETEKPAWKRKGYFGHTPVDSYIDTDELLPIAGPQIVLLDTAVALLPHGRLTAFCHEANTFIQTDANGTLVAVEP